MNVSESNTLQFPCKRCGAQLKFTPGSQNLSCSYCGHEETLPNSEEEIAEHPFEDYKGDLEDGSWGPDVTHMECEQCGASSEVTEHTTASVCAFCGAPGVTGGSAGKKRKPESVLTFQVPRSHCDDMFRDGVKTLWFRPNALKTLARPDALKGIYLPYWTYDALTQSWWNAESGTHYYVTETYQSAGKTKTRTVKRTRWVWVNGTHNAFYDDVTAAGSDTLPEELRRGIEPFDTHQLQPYTPETLAGFQAENYQHDMLDCWPQAQSIMEKAIQQACIAAIPGDTYRNLRISTHFSNQTYKLCLLPAWVANYRFNGKVYRFLVNGHSGKIHGEAPWSWVKITTAAATTLAIAYGLYEYFLGI